MPAEQPYVQMTDAIEQAASDQADFKTSSVFLQGASGVHKAGCKLFT